MKLSGILAWSLGVAVLINPMVTIAASIGDPQQKSSSYRVDESTVGAMGDYGQASTNYKQLGGTDGGSTLGDLTVGSSNSSNYRVDGGSNTTNTPVLSFSVNTTSVDLGIASMNATNTGSATFSVKNYTSSGYSVTLMGSTPTYNGHSIAPMAATALPAAGTEQFGVNLRANTSPTSFGAEPLQVPNASFSFGSVASGYNVANQFRFNSGEAIATSSSSSGQTDFTLSYVMNISTGTPAGVYRAQQSLVATATF